MVGSAERGQHDFAVASDGDFFDSLTHESEMALGKIFLVIASVIGIGSISDKRFD